MSPETQALKTKIESVLETIKTFGDEEGDIRGSRAAAIPEIPLSRDMRRSSEGIGSTRMLLRSHYTDLVNHLLKRYKIFHLKFDPPATNKELEGMELYTKWVLEECEEPPEDGDGAGAAEEEDVGAGAWLKSSLSGLLDVKLAIGLSALFGLATAIKYHTGTDVGGMTDRAGEQDKFIQDLINACLSRGDNN